MPNITKPLTFLLTLSGSLLTIASVGAFLDNFSLRFQLLSQLRVQLALALLIVMLPLFLLCWRVALILMIAFVINCAHFVPLYFSQPASAAVDSRQLTISHVNIDRDKVEMLDKLNGHGSDIVFIQEVQPTVSDEFAARMPDYDVQLVASRWDTRGSAMLVRNDWAGELISAEYLQITTYGDRPLAHAVLNFNGRQLSILSLHVTRPENPLQAVEFADVAQWSRAQQAAGHEVLIVGDFNQTPWSGRFRKLLADGDLQNGQLGYGLQTTWPARLPPFLRIPIDHTVHSDGVILTERAVGANWGGDHRPIHLTVMPTSP